jgi:hypothetical protein
VASAEVSFLSFGAQLVGVLWYALALILCVLMRLVEKHDDGEVRRNQCERLMMCWVMVVPGSSNDNKALLP